METNWYLFHIAAVVLILKDKKYFSKMYSICFSGSKCSRDLNPVLDLMRLNRFVLTNNFKVERLQSILGIIRQEEILSSLASLSQFFKNLQFRAFVFIMQCFLFI